MKAIRLKRAWIVFSTAVATAYLMGGMAQVNAQTQVSDAFTGTTTSNPWEHFGYACLTANTTAGTFPVTSNNTTAVPGCGLGTPDAAGYGALRLTGAVTNETGAILSPASMAFPANQGIQVTFTTYTYGGNSYSSSSSYPQTGADGIAFYLLDASTPSPNLGSFGGSLGYSCANAKGTSSTNPGGSNGMPGAYLGLGMDEFGNYLNSGDNTYTGVAVGTSGTTGSSISGAYTIPNNPYTGSSSSVTDSGGSEFQPNRIGLRGYGNVNLPALTAAATAGGATTMPTNADVEATCKNGGTYNYTVNNTSQPLYNYTYTYNSGGRNGTQSYSGGLYQKNSNNNYTQQGSTVSTPSASSGYTGTGTAYAKSGNSYYALTITSTASGTYGQTAASATFADYPVIANANYIVDATNNTYPIANENASTRVGSTTATSAVAINYKLQVTAAGLLSLSYSYNGGTYVPVITGHDISASNGTMPTSFLFGFGASTGGGTNVHEITCFLATPANLAASSAGLNVEQSGEVRSGTQVYLAFYHPNNWWGQLDAEQLLVNSATNSVTINPVATWDASCVLTGGNCPSMESTSNPTVSITAQTSRTLVTWSGSAGIPFTEGRLTATQLGWLEAGTTTGATGATNLVDYLSGGRSNEIPSSGATGTQIYRARTSVLGDIMDASPVWVGAPSGPYAATWADKLWPSDTVPENASTATNYPSWVTSNATRLNVVYMGANDGFMHAFESGSYASDGVTFNSSTNDGKELFAYMPEAALQSIHNGTTPALDYSGQNYAHNYTVDATPGTGDLFYNNTWHTWLVGGMGPGGNAIYAIDISSPTTLGVGNIIGEWGANTGTSTAPATSSINPVTGKAAATGTNPLACTNVTNCQANLGQTYGTPQIRRLHNGEWAVIFGNGLNSASGNAGIYVMTINSGGSVDKVYYLDTGVTGSSTPDGIAYVTPVDLDGDHITDYVYAGDTLGNVWRFDLTSDTPANWGVTNYGSGTTPKPLFTTPTVQACTPPATTGCTKVSTKQPITTALLVLSVAPTSVGTPRVMVEFGTGDVVTPQTTTASIQYSAGQQTLYGIWDWNMGTTNSPGSSFASLSGSTAPTTAISTSQLLQQTITSETSASTSGSGVGYRTVSNTTICFVGMGCGTSSGVYGWYLNLTGHSGNNGVGGNDETEQVIYSPIESEGAFIVNTTIPANNAPTSCAVSNAQGWTMALNPATGGAFEQSFFSAMGGGSINVNGAPVSGIAVNGTGSPSVVNAMGNPYLISQTVTGAGTVNQINPQPMSGGRLTWLQLH